VEENVVVSVVSVDETVAASVVEEVNFSVRHLLLNTTVPEG
jgi:hypothetical protein